MLLLDCLLHYTRHNDVQIALCQTQKSCFTCQRCVKSLNAKKKKKSSIFSTIVCWINDGLLMMLLFFPFLFLEKWMCWKAVENAQCLKPTRKWSKLYLKIRLLILVKAKISLKNNNSIACFLISQCCGMSHETFFR